MEVKLADASAHLQLASQPQRARVPVLRPSAAAPGPQLPSTWLQGHPKQARQWSPESCTSAAGTARCDVLL